MDREEWVENLANAIETAVHKAVGMLDHVPERTSRQIAETAADDIPGYTWDS